MQIPVDRLDPETLTRVIEEYVSREGTDYGMGSPDLLAKVESIRRKLKSGAAVLCYDEQSESCQIVTKEAWQTLQKGGAQPEPSPSNEYGIDF